MNLAQWKMESPIGPLYLVASENGLRGIFFDKQSTPLTKTLKGTEKPILLLAQTVQELEEYFQGRRQQFTLPFDIDGTPFQMRVWKELSKIPYGKTYSYRDIASRIQNPR